MIDYNLSGYKSIRFHRLVVDFTFLVHFVIEQIFDFAANSKRVMTDTQSDVIIIFNTEVSAINAFILLAVHNTGNQKISER